MPIESVKDILANPLNPFHDEIANTMIDLQTGNLSMCSCVGALYGEPYCPCEMTRRRLPMSKEHEVAYEKTVERLKALANAGIFKDSPRSFK